jgi:hypothetical protein
MSKIALSGPAGGTATYTVTAPTGAVDRTLTLPDQSGTLLSGSGAISVNASAPVPSVTVNASGNVGIGTSSFITAAKLQVSGASATAGIVSEDTSGTTSFVRVLADATQENLINWKDGRALRFATSTDGFGNYAERARIDSSGNLLVGTTTTFGGQAGITSATNFIVGTSSQYWKTTNFSATYYFNYNGSDKAAINGSTGAYTALSDVNKKKDFESSEIGLDVVMQLQPKLFRMLDDEDDAPKQLGFIAQEVQPFVPQAYVEQDTPDGKFIGLQDRPIIAVLVKAIQEQQALIVQLQADVAALKGTQP